MGIIGHEFTYKNRIYQFCTGYENEPSTCWWCDSVFESKRKRMFCSDNCKFEYLRHFYWVEASNWCRNRADNKCQICYCVSEWIDHSYGGRSNLEVHHIIPTRGANRVQHPLNAPCNLLLLCMDCHNKTKKKLENIRNEFVLEESKRCQEVMDFSLTGEGR